ncbi:MAG: acyltransferase [Planctomycetaceae bacterium]|nr:acyltransferase [Planctomycetaceae bacterium]
MSPRLAGLDGLRALACLWVVVHHMVVVDPPLWTPEGYWRRLLQRGDLGVGIFFVLSGFLLSHPFWDANLRGRTAPSLRIYFAKRVGRILPAYYVCVLACGVVALARYDLAEIVRRCLAAMTFANSLFPDYFFPFLFNSPLWSISVEMLFYLLLPPYLAAALRIRSTPRRLLLGVAVIVLLGAAQAAFNVMMALSPDAPSGERWAVTHNAPFLFSLFLMGVVASDCYTTLAHMSGGTSRRLGTLGDWLGGVLLVSVFAVDPADVVPGIGRGESYGLCYRWPVFGALIAVLLPSLCLSNFIGEKLDSPFLRRTAKLSYGIYLWHFPLLLMATKHLLGTEPTFALRACGGVLVLAGSYLIAAVSYAVVERPVLDIVNRYARNTR